MLCDKRHPLIEYDDVFGAVECPACRAIGEMQLFREDMEQFLLEQFGQHGLHLWEHWSKQYSPIGGR